MTALAVVMSGVGALTRYGLGGVVHRRVGGTRPWGTAVVNLTGATALGLLYGLTGNGKISASAMTVLGTGFLGGFTTFSTWMVETIRLAEEGRWSGGRAAVWNVAGMMLVGLVGFGTGAMIG